MIYWGPMKNVQIIFLSFILIAVGFIVASGFIFPVDTATATGYLVGAGLSFFIGIIGLIVLTVKDHKKDK